MRAARAAAKGGEHKGAAGEAHLRVVALPHPPEVFRPSDIEPLYRVLALDNLAGSEANGGRDDVRQLVFKPKEQRGLAGVVQAQQ